MWLSENTLKKLIKGTFLATLLLAAQEGGRPFHEAAWILIGATLTTVVDAYATPLSHRSYGDFLAYAHSLWVGLVEDSPRTFATPSLRSAGVPTIRSFSKQSPDTGRLLGRDRSRLGQRHAG